MHISGWFGSVLDLNCDVKPTKRKARAFAAQMARKSEIPISLIFPRLEVLFCMMFEFPALGRISTLTATTTVWRDRGLSNVGPSSGHLSLLLFKRAWLGRVKELLEALVSLHCWEKQRNDVMSGLMAASRAIFFVVYSMRIQRACNSFSSRPYALESGLLWFLSSRRTERTNPRIVLWAFRCIIFSTCCVAG